MGLRDLFRRKPAEDDWTARLARGESGPSGAPAPSSGPVPSHRATPVVDAAASRVSVTTTRIGPDGIPVTTSDASGADILASLPPQARRQLEALGLDGLVTGGAQSVDWSQAFSGWSQLAQGLGAGAAVDGTAGARPDPVEQLKALAELRDRGHVTEEEFAEQKRKLLDEI